MTELRRVDRRGTVNLPVGVRQGVDLVEVVRRKDGVIELRPRLVVDPAQAWFWSDRWQAMEREADDDVADGRVKRFNDVESLLTELDEEE
jgi:bifunctional DNA-binding transcriptional regulator/antitoxin component of YhaV-PrlF toxin-antitoxin module